ncbi:PREDICTED: uncharacterized protein LOC104587099 [Nelumbo nucifera]|uniref:Uncharacterized protein LOC104587099 n=2 Tax=Nelumbo nucifera TaxID=4432 RepID=A0A1U7Z5V1_NELNU|nr:PREDICTED: uncharacterized protein LOC104587099 [Nelumbo nucifera]DAD46584.1 TPA_asm: hypothetical protein HUJ06_016521 [Nelumbo nucifera]
MGCATSKLDDLPAVALCRYRCQFLDEAIRQCYAFADAHVAYIRSLERVALSLHRLFHQEDADNSAAAAPPSPVLPLATQRKGDPVVLAHEPSTSPRPPAAVTHHSHSNSGSHLHFNSDSDDDGSLHHSSNSSPLHDYNNHPQDYDMFGSFTAAGYTTMNFMKNQATPSVSYEQRPMTETVYVGDSSSYYSYPYPYPTPHSYYAYPPENHGSGSGPPPGVYDSSSPPPAAAPSSSSSSKPPPPPSPPRNSLWDFLNLFDTTERYYHPYTPSRDSRKVREEEGIPDLEDEEYGVAKEVHGFQKLVDTKNTAEDENAKGNVKDGTIHQTKPSASKDKDGLEYEVHMVDKNVVSNEQRIDDQANNVVKPRPVSQSASEVVTIIKVQFERASVSGNEVSKILEAGKLPYHRKNAVYQVSSRMLHVITPSLSIVAAQPSTSKNAASSSSSEKAGPVYLEFEEDVGILSGNLSSTLKKLFMWEKKLLDEIKEEEKTRLVHERKSRQLKHLDEKGAESHKVDSTRTTVKNLSTKIKIAIEFVDRISNKISKLRDEELWPQINELIQGLLNMWKVMLECHQNQCQVIVEAKNLDAIVFNRKLSSAQLEATVQFQHELLNWISNFSGWISAQKGFVDSLNGWLLKCLHYEPEETPDGMAPFSPGRIGAPLIFVICHQWSQALEGISEREVVEAMCGFALSVKHNIDVCQRMIVHGDVEGKVKTLDREELKMQKAIQALNKKMVLVCEQENVIVVHQGDITNGSLQLGLKKIFDAMEKFIADSFQAYEDLRVRSEDRFAQEKAKVP